MPKRTVCFLPGEFYHLYNKAVTNNLLFIEDKNYLFFLSKIKKYLLDSVDVLAFCLMPNHYHLVVKLKNPDLPRSMQQLAMSYTASFNKVYNRVGHLFQGRYQAKLITNQTYLNQLVRYVHLNPCNAGLVNKPAAWSMSSYREYIGLKSPDFIKTKIILDLYGSGNDLTFQENQLNYKKYIEEL